MVDETLVGSGAPDLERTYTKVHVCKPGDTIRLNTKEGTSSMIGGRFPQTKETTVNIPENCLAAQLDGTTADDTSRIQFIFYRNKTGIFKVRNLSENVSFLTKSNLRGKQPVGPGRSIILGNRPDQLAGMEIYWDRYSLKQAGSLGETSDGNWSIEFKYLTSQGIS